MASTQTELNSHICDVTIVIPSYKPTDTLIRVVSGLVEHFENVVVVDDGGGEAYADIFNEVEKLGALVVTHATNQGKGRALKTAFNFCLLNNIIQKGVITVDGDGQHRVDDVVRIAKELEKNSENVVLGCRIFTGKSIPLRSRLGNNISKVVYRWACDLKLSDTQTGLRGIPKYLVPLCCRVAGEKYDYETNMLLAIRDSGANFIEVNIETVYEGKNESSHFNPIRDSFLIYAVIIKYSLSSLVTSIVDYIAFLSLLSCGLSILKSTYGARFIACIINFVINKKVVFENKDKGYIQFLKYALLVFVSGTISGVAISYISNLFAFISPLAIKIPVEIVLYLFNYFVQRTMIFKEKRKHEEK